MKIKSLLSILASYVYSEVFMDSSKRMLFQRGLAEDARNLDTRWNSTAVDLGESHREEGRAWVGGRQSGRAIWILAIVHQTLRSLLGESLCQCKRYELLMRLHVRFGPSSSMQIHNHLC